MKRQITAAILTMALVSASFAQMSESYCAAMAANESEQIKILHAVQVEMKKSEKLRAVDNGTLVIDDLISSRQRTLEKTQKTVHCSVSQYKDSLQSILNERIKMQEASLEMMDKLIKIGEEQTGSSTVFMTGVGMVGLIYTLLMWKNGYFLVKWVIGGISLFVTLKGGYNLSLDHFISRPVLNDIKEARKATAAQLKTDTTQLKALDHVRLN